MLAGAASAHAATITIDSPENGAYINDTTPAVQYSGAELNGSIALRANGDYVYSGGSDATGAGTITPTAISDAPGETVELVMSDGGGSVSDPVDVTVNQVPRFDVGDDSTTREGDTVTNERISFDVTGAIPGNPVDTAQDSYILLYVSGVSTPSYFDADPTGAAKDISPWEDLDPGTHTAYVVTEDAEGVESSRSEEVTFTVAPAPAEPVFKDLFDSVQLNQSQPVLNLTNIDPAADEVTLYHVVEVDDTGASVAFATSTDIDRVNHTATITPTLTDGMHSLSVTQTVNGVETGDDNSYPTPVTVYVNASAPTLSSNDDGQLTNEIPYFDINGALQSLGGDGDNTNIVELYIDGALAGSDDTDGGGNAGIRPETVTDGAHTAYAVTVDDLGHRSTVHSNEVTFTLDTTAPGAPTLVSPANGSVITTNIPQVTVTAEPGTRVHVLVDDVGEENWQTVDANGNAKFTLSEALADGEHHLYVFAQDAAGNYSDFGYAAFTVKTATTVPPVTPPVPPTVTPTPTPTPATPAAPTKLTLSSSTLTKSKPVKVGFTLKKAGTVKVTITKTVKGKTVTVATDNVKVKKAGKGTYTLRTKVGGKTLRKGKYKVSLQTVNGKKKSKSVSAKVSVR
jgi:hypothetical protein